MAGARLVTFFTQYLNHPGQIGAVTPSSAALARAVSKTLLNPPHPLQILEVGAGTGAITREIIKRLHDRDHLDVCEPLSALADVVERDVLSIPEAEPARREGRIHLHRTRIETLGPRAPYDVVIAGLPFNAFEPQTVRNLLEHIRSISKPGAFFSYYEYMGLGLVCRSLGMGKTRRRMKAVNEVMQSYIDEYEYERQAVWLNTPPAWARHWKW